ncbi:hypothetical protein BJF79_22765 [Actinomadura sp. CNU-125]|uniref:hypothetical protein n=1 Tax=Actinomadura sp. CNU-125 TaxID=1904961 RepID=UPI0009684D74|nr:hypothetical protein [Actinomadura sp. CNU-125]OLT12209.1 hypothetical protein BJF79_22765 [Actinomadura sp. CNU-125]
MSLDDAMRRAADERLQARLAANRSRRDNRRRRLAELTERRRHGLTARHRNKLRNTADPTGRKPMTDPNDVRRRTAMRRTTSLAPDDIQTIALPGGVSVVVDMIDRTITVDGPTAGWKVTDKRSKAGKR